MAERAPVVANRGVLTALRAAAIVVIATGLNDVLAGTLPRYEPLYLYLAAIALVVLLDGLILGTFAAILAIAAYYLLFERAIPVLPVAEAAGVIAAGALVRGLVRSRRREPAIEIFAAQSTPLLPPPAVTVDNTEVLTAIDGLRAELREVVSLRAHQTEEMSRLEFALARATEELRQAGGATEAARGDLAVSQFEGGALRQRISELEIMLAQTENVVAGLNHTRRASDAERGQHLERIAELEQSAVSESTSAQARSNELHRALDDAAAERVRLESALAAAREEGSSLAGRVTELGLALSSLRGETEAERRRVATAQSAHGEETDGLRRALETERARAIALSGDVNEARTKIVHLGEELDLERARAATQQALREEQELAATAREDDNLRLRARIDELEQGLAEGATATEKQVEEVRLALEAQRRRADEERARRESAERDAKTGHSDADALRALVAELEESLAIESTMRAEAADLRRMLEEEKTRADDAVAQCQGIKAEFDSRLQTIVTHLAADHETDLGKAVEQREEARAEARSSALKLSVVQRKMDEERTAISVKLRDADERHRGALEDSARVLAETREVAQLQVDTLRARLSNYENVAPLVPRGKPRVLVAHPDANLRTNARALLERSGYEVVSAADGLEALRIAIAQHPDVVIADASMPKMDGRELCQLLKSQHKTAHIRVILLSQAGDDRPRGEFPPDSILSKPVPLEVLRTTLADLMGTRA